MTEYTTLSDKLNKLPRQRQETIELRASQVYIEESTLRHLREKLGLSPSELAEHFEIYQPALSNLEHRHNLELNTVRAFVNALGGTIEIIVRVPNKEPILLSDYQE